MSKCTWLKSRLLYVIWDMTCYTCFIAPHGHVNFWECAQEFDFAYLQLLDSLHFWQKSGMFSPFFSQTNEKLMLKTFKHILIFHFTLNEHYILFSSSEIENAASNNMAISGDEMTEQNITERGGAAGCLLIIPDSNGDRLIHRFYCCIYILCKHGPRALAFAYK